MAILEHVSDEDVEVSLEENLPKIYDPMLPSYPPEVFIECSHWFFYSLNAQIDWLH
jgi:hypothetical protein